jgi:prevent-host-death family protein
METKWQLQDAKNRFSELVEKAITLGPQTVTKRGKETVVVLSVEEYKKLTKPKFDLV